MVTDTTHFPVQVHIVLPFGVHGSFPCIVSQARSTLTSAASLPSMSLYCQAFLIHASLEVKQDREA